MESQTVSVRLNADNRIEVRVGDEFQIGETWYLAMHADGDDRQSSLLAALRQLLADWRDAVAQTSIGQIVYLPFDFSDEVTSWLACHCNEDTVTIVTGRIDMEGWEISGADWREQSDFGMRFVVNEPTNPQTINREWLLMQVQFSIDHLSTLPSSP